MHFESQIDGGHQKKISSVGIYLLIGPMLVVQKFQLTKYTNSHSNILEIETTCILPF